MPYVTPLHVTVPDLRNILGARISLEDSDRNLLLPKLKHLRERTSSKVETYEVYYVHTGFRFSFYGRFSPAIMTILSIAADEDSWIDEPAQRFPSTLLSKTKVLQVPTFNLLKHIFPIVWIEGEEIISPDNFTAARRLPQRISSPLSHKVEEIHLPRESLFSDCNEGENQDEDFLEHLESAFIRFPKLQEVHLSVSCFDHSEIRSQAQACERLSRELKERLKAHSNDILRQIVLKTVYQSDLIEKYSGDLFDAFIQG